MSVCDKQQILIVSIKVKIFTLEADIIKTIQLHQNARVYGICYSNNCLFLSDHHFGVQYISLTDYTIHPLLQTSDYCKQVHGICISGNVLYITDLQMRQVLVVEGIQDLPAIDRNQDIRVSVCAGSGDSGIKDGLGHQAQFLQPSGICAHH